MLSAITLDGFRCFAEPTRVTFGNLTVLAGAINNSAGKSSVLDALLSLMQSEQQPIEGHLRLSGAWVEIGCFKQALNYSRQGKERRLSIGLSSRNNDCDTDMVVTLGEPDESFPDAAKIQRIETYTNDMELAFELRGYARRGSPFRRLTRDDPSSAWKPAGEVAGSAYPWTAPGVDRLLPQAPDSVLYLNAFRDLPRKFYPRRSSDLGPLLGAMGEYVAETLFTRRNVTVDVLPTGGPPQILGEALEAWWVHIFGGDYSIRAEAAGDDLGFTLGPLREAGAPGDAQRSHHPCDPARAEEQATLA